MYAIIQHSGRQFKVKQGDVILLDRTEAVPGEEISFDKVLFFEGRAGAPYLEGVHVTGRVKGPALGPKIYVQKFKRRKNYRRRTGHRQPYTEVEITSIEG